MKTHNHEPRNKVNNVIKKMLGVVIMTSVLMFGAPTGFAREATRVEIDAKDTDPTILLHIDSWEMGPQNWTARFRYAFQQRRGYDLLYYLPAMTGRVVESLGISERFLWDVRHDEWNDGRRIASNDSLQCLTGSLP